MRGLPGSGKSTLANEIAAKSEKSIILSTDDIVSGRNGEYLFDVSLLGPSHTLNFRKFEIALGRDFDTIIVDNTNTTFVEMKRYIEVSLEHEIQFLEPKTSWSKDPAECAKRTTHGVPLDIVKKMAARYECNNDCYSKTVLLYNEKIQE